MSFAGVAVASVSLGKPEGSHRIESVLRSAAKHGFQGIELVHEHLVEYAHRVHGNVSEPAVLEASVDVRRFCNELQLEIIALQPFALYEGQLDREAHRKSISKMYHWIDLAHALGADLIQMPSNFAEDGITDDLNTMVADLVELADITGAAKPPIRLAYEAVAWGTYVDLWEQSWEIVKRVDRPNFGLCLDTFHIAGRVWADPCSETGKTASAEEDLEASLALMRKLPVEKVFYLQLSDAEKLTPPYSPGHEMFEDGGRARCLWSRGARLFPFEEDRGGYLPISAIASTIIQDVGYRGWVSMEIFSRHLCKPCDCSTVPDEYAQRAMRSFQNLWKTLRLDE
ncbi:hypothetical protein LTR17_024850 [Elasticomyces elasticus]|nr:hypothetical protein LTR17_024850 [Elasticomyces elasticus]